MRGTMSIQRSDASPPKRAYAWSSRNATAPRRPASRTISPTASHSASSSEYPVGLLQGKLKRTSDRPCRSI